MTTTKGLLKAHVNLEVVATPMYHRVFHTNDGLYCVAYHLAGDLWNVVGDARNAQLAQQMCDQLNTPAQQG